MRGSLHPIPAAALITFCTKLCQPRRLARDGNSNDRGSQTALVKLALASVLLWAAWLASRFGGVTGDVLGSSVERGELATLVAVAALMHLRVL